MSEVVNLSRRGFLKAGLAAGGGLVLGVHVPGLGRLAEPAAQAPADFAPNAYLRIAADETVTVFAGHSEMGQGVYTEPGACSSPRSWTPTGARCASKPRRSIRLSTTPSTAFR